MHRYLAIFLIAAVLGLHSAQAGVILFDPPEITIDPSAGPTTGAFAVTVVSDSAKVDAINLIFASIDIALTGFTYTPDIMEAFGAFAVTPQPVGLAAHDLFVGGFASEGLPQKTLLGILAVDVAALSPATYSVRIDNFPCDFDACPFPMEQWSGGALVHVVPEPASIGLLLLGCAAVCGWKRRTQHKRSSEHDVDQST